MRTTELIHSYIPKYLFFYNPLKKRKEKREKKKFSENFTYKILTEIFEKKFYETIKTLKIIFPDLLLIQFSIPDCLTCGKIFFEVMTNFPNC